MQTFPVVVVWEHEYDSPRIQENNFDNLAESLAYQQGVRDCDPTGEWYALFNSLDAAEDYLRETDRADCLRG